MTFNYTGGGPVYIQGIELEQTKYRYLGVQLNKGTSLYSKSATLNRDKVRFVFTCRKCIGMKPL